MCLQPLIFQSTKQIIISLLLSQIAQHFSSNRARDEELLVHRNRAKGERKGYDKEQINGKVLSVTKCDFKIHFKMLKIYLLN